MNALLGIVLVSSSAAASSDAGDTPIATRGGCAPRDDGLSCHGNMVLLGDGKEQLVQKCGRANSEALRCYRHPYLPLNQCIDIWTYQLDSGSFPRRVTLVDGKVQSIVAISRSQ
jgi:hypothetical protein